MYGTLKNVPDSQLIEMPVCENLMVGMAVGLALEDFLPVVCFERHDFILLGLDALVNHVDKMPHLSGDQYKLPIVIRAIVGAKEPLNPGPQHTQDYTKELESMLKYTQVYTPQTEGEFQRAWGSVGQSQSGASVIIEHRDMYEREIPTIP